MPVIKTFVFSYANLGYMYDTKQSIKPHSISMDQTGSKPVFLFGISLNSIYITHLLTLFAV